MYKRTLFMLLAAVVFWGMRTALPGAGFGQEPMLAQSNAEKPSPAHEDAAYLGEALTILYSTERIMLRRDDKDLSRIFAAGPRMARLDDAALRESDDEPMQEGPSLTMDDGGGPSLDTAGDDPPPAHEDSVFLGEALTILHSTERVMLRREDKELSRIFAAGPRMARLDDAALRESDDEPMQEGPSLAVDTAGDDPPPAHEDSVFAEEALKILHSTEQIMLLRNDGDLSRIFGAGPRMARLGDDASRKKDDAPMQDGPVLAMDDSSGPDLALDDSGGPTLDTGGEDPPAPEADIAPAEIPRDQEALYREVRELREAVDKLRGEAEAREFLRVTEDEERDEEKEILEAAGREYTLRPPKTISVNLSANYSYNDYDVIRQIQEQQGTLIEHRSDHQITNSFSLETGLRDNLSIDASVPFVYKYDKVDTAQSRDVSGLGDASVGLKYQPLKTGQGYPAPIFSLEYTWPTGKSPFEINPNTELSTGSGFHEISGGVSVSQPFDPVNAFASLRYLYRLPETGIGQRRGRGTLDEVNPGDQISVSLGFGYAVSYRMSLSLSLSTSYASSTDYYWLAREGRDKTSSTDNLSASLGLNTSWRVTPKRTVVIGIGKGLTTANPGFSFYVRLPVTFRL